MVQAADTPTATDSHSQKKGPADRYPQVVAELTIDAMPEPLQLLLGEEALMDRGEGITSEDLPAIYREGYLHAIELARAQHDPSEDWEGFRETLWHSLVRVFGVDIDGPWPDDVPDPRGRVSGDAHTVATWMRQRLGEAQPSSTSIQREPTREISPTSPASRGSFVTGSTSTL